MPPHSVAPVSWNFGVSSVGFRNRAPIRRMTGDTDFFGMVFTFLSRYGYYLLDLDAGCAFPRRRADSLDLPRPTTHKTVLSDDHLAREALKQGFTDHGLLGRRTLAGRLRTSSAPATSGPRSGDRFLYIYETYVL